MLHLPLLRSEDHLYARQVAFRSSDGCRVLEGVEVARAPWTGIRRRREMVVERPAGNDAPLAYLLNESEDGTRRAAPVAVGCRR